MNSAHQKPNTYQKKPMVQQQSGCVFHNNEGYKIQKGTTFTSYDELVHALIRYEMAARVHLLRSSSNFLKANKNAFSDEICQQFVFDRLVFKCPNHEVIKRFDSQTGEALYNKRVTKKNSEDTRKCEFTFTVQYNPQINRLEISAGMLCHTGGCNPSAKDLFEYVPKDENNKKKRAIHKKIEELEPAQLPPIYPLVKETVAFKSKNRTMQSPNLNAPFYQDTDVGTIQYAPEVEVLISRYVTDCIKKPAGEESKAGSSTSRGTKRRMADEGEVAAKRANDGHALRPNTNYEVAEVGQVSYVGQGNYICEDGTAQLERHVQPVQEIWAASYEQNPAYYQSAGPSQGYWNQPVANYEPYHYKTATQQQYSQATTYNNMCDQLAANNGFFEPKWNEYKTFGQQTCHLPANNYQDMPNPVAENPIEQPAYIPPYNDASADVNNKRTSQNSASPGPDDYDYDWFNPENYLEPAVQIPGQGEETAAPLAQAPEDDPAIEEPEPGPQQDLAHVYYYDEEEMRAVGSGGADLIAMAMEGLLD
ncbi:unnamed protein product [Bursaphelenchus okinawaensis]|uniref:Uncharacterized protein n=1 Tax=Bursaphelenchus okinawaensis TaxID=465554 RepID=A0A811LPR4_9BILA|nr:unnamed protein product [Bursaphelenchus okinawaensis]CAG9127689.1 unnamed protein product [Bursaphelenchus okinawaensis]